MLGQNKLLQTIYNVNMLPELVQMQCFVMGAWGIYVSPMTKEEAVAIAESVLKFNPGDSEALAVVQDPSLPKS